MIPLVALCASLMWVWVLSTPIALGKDAVLKEQIKQEQTTLQKLKEKIKETKKKRKRAKKQHDSVLQSIEDLDRKLYAHRKDFKKINRQIKSVDLTLAKIGAQLADLHSSLGKRKESVRARVRLLYMEGQVGLVKPLFAARSVSRFQRRLMYLAIITQWEHALLQGYRDDLAHTDQLRAQQSDSRGKLLDHKQRIEKSLKSIKSIKGKKRVVLTSLKKTGKLHDRALMALQRAESRKENLLNALEQRRKLAENKMVAIPGGALVRGDLVWPVDGKVVGWFGRQKHPTFDTYVKNKGIEIETLEGEPIRAVSPGNVVYADWLKGYGLVVIVEHNKGFFSLYAHASKLVVKEGESVDAGSVIGETGESGLTDKNLLYFELRKGTKPVNPLKWLAKRN
ncbi:MAG: peptidoglycan DD-metalloendopeptidase family protein [Nitrospirota bacterium]|nr:peptidoglycan DD-metalloendopeptidase family protein [Nitrospirota bacterium]